jgi:peptidoglycan/xylan/chitin deacetylase (PgdA/CDA1 family)
MMFSLSPSAVVRSILKACEVAASFVLFHSGIIDACIRLRSKKRVAILFYHEVGHKPFLGAAAVTPETFEKQIKYIAKRYRGVSMNDLHAHLSGKVTLPDHPVIVTFDGGYRGNLEHAYPILKRHNIPCLIYLVTEYIEKQELPYTFKLGYIVENRRKEYVTMGFPDRERVFRLRIRHERMNCINDILIYLRTLSSGQRESLLADLAEKLDIDVESFPREIFLTWEEAREMARESLVSFGSHSITHPNLLNVTAEEATREVTESKREIERQISCKVTSFCYPMGYFSRRTKDLVRKAGYESATTTVYGLNGYESDPFELRRIAVRELPLSIFAAELAGLYRSGTMMLLYDRVRNRLKRLLNRL